MAFLNHTLGILLHPDEEWKAIRKEKSSFQQVFLSHVPFLALIPCVCGFYGVTQVGWTIGGGDPVHLSVNSALSLCALAYFAFLAGVFVFGEFVNWMSTTYGVRDSKERRHYEGTALAVYVTTPIFLSGIVNVYPQLWLVSLTFVIAASYAVYLIYEGTPILMNIDKDRAFMYASSIVTIGLVMLVSTMILTVLVWGLGVGPEYTD